MDFAVVGVLLLSHLVFVRWLKSIPGQLDCNRTCCVGVGSYVVPWSIRECVCVQVCVCVYPCKCLARVVRFNQPVGRVGYCCVMRLITLGWPAFLETCPALNLPNSWIVCGLHGYLSPTYKVSLKCLCHL